MTTPDSTKPYHDQAQKFFEQTAKKSGGCQIRPTQISA